MSSVGKKIENISLSATNGIDFKVPSSTAALIYFYPKDDTPGCTIQACSYRDNINSFKDADISVFGVSADDMSSHEAFSGKFDLNFPLIVDSDKTLAATLGVTGRDTFLVSKNGEVLKEWKSVDPKTTVEQTLEEAKIALKD